MNDNASHAAVPVLRSFFAAMHEWEVDALRQSRAVDERTYTREQHEAFKSRQRQLLTNIFEMFCEVGGKAKRLKDDGLAFGDPPDYDPSGESIVSVVPKGKKVIVETQQEFGMRWKKRYELVERDGKWKIRDNAMLSSKEDPKWVRDLL